MLTGLSRNRFEERRKEILQDFPQIKPENIPTHHQFCKDLPPFELITVGHGENGGVTDLHSDEIINSNIDDLSLSTLHISPPVSLASTTQVSSFIGRRHEMSFSDSLDLLNRSIAANDNIEFTRLCGGMSKYVTMLVDKFERMNVAFNDTTPIMIIDSYDGAQNR